MERKQWKQLDEEWLILVKELMESEVSKNDFRSFIEFKKLEKEKLNAVYKSS